MNSQWLTGPLVMDYNYALKSPVVEIYTYPQSARMGKYSVEFYDKNRYVSRKTTDDSINIDKNVTDLRITLTDNQQIPTAMDEHSLYEMTNTFPKVKSIVIHSQMITPPPDNDNKLR